MPHGHLIQCTACFVLQINAKLFLFVPEAQTWSEKGHGLLRVNDMIEDDTGAFQSRLGKDNKVMESGGGCGGGGNH